MGQASIIYANREIEGERLELTDKNSNYYLGPNLTLRHCTVVLRVSARWLHLLPTRFIDSSFQVKQELKNHQDWLSVSLKGCRFTGRLSGCDFGRWPQWSDDWEHGAIEDCDFSEARLDGCRFHGCDIRTLRFPSWPCFTFLEPLRHAPTLNSVQWPGRFGHVIIEAFPEETPPSTRALTHGGGALPVAGDAPGWDGGALHGEGT